MKVAARFAENLIRHRKQAGLSQEDLGFLSSLHRTEVGLLERGARLPRIDTLVKLASALAVPVDSLLRGIAWSPGHVEAGKFTTGGSEDGEAD